MRGMTRFAMGAAVALAVGLALVFTLLIFLLADLFCSVLCRRGRGVRSVTTSSLDTTSSPSITEAAATQMTAEGLPLGFPAFYAHGVLQAPTSFLLTIPNLEAAAAKTVPPSAFRPVMQTSAPPMPTSRFLRWDSPASMTSSSSAEPFVYISNPIFDGNDEDGEENGSTPFATPGSSPSRLDYEEESESDRSPPLMAMSKLPPARSRAPFAGQTDGRRSLATSASATETNRAFFSSSSSSPCSPSW